jgi:replicative DNA helicase
LNREGESGGVAVTMRQARGSGVIEESADIMIGGWRPSLAEGISDDEKIRLEREGTFYQEILKNRSGKTGRVSLHFTGENLRVDDIEFRKFE